MAHDAPAMPYPNIPTALNQIARLKLAVVNLMLGMPRRFRICRTAQSQAEHRAIRGVRRFTQTDGGQGDQAMSCSIAKRVAAERVETLSLP